jgi:hypothetical protein
LPAAGDTRLGEGETDAFPQNPTDVELPAGQSADDDADVDLSDVEGLSAHDARRGQEEGDRPLSANISAPTRRRISLARLTSDPIGTGTSTTARAQSRERFVT